MGLGFIDTSAIIALKDPSDQYHKNAVNFMQHQKEIKRWMAVDVTGFEAFTHARMAYKRARNIDFSIEHLNFVLSNSKVTSLRHEPNDILVATRTIVDNPAFVLSFHDALVGAVMIRKRAYRIFTFDNDFATMGFEIVNQANSQPG